MQKYAVSGLWILYRHIQQRRLTSALGTVAHPVAALHEALGIRSNSQDNTMSILLKFCFLCTGILAWSCGDQLLPGSSNEKEYIVYTQYGSSEELTSNPRVYFVRPDGTGQRLLGSGVVVATQAGAAALWRGRALGDTIDGANLRGSGTLRYLLSLPLPYMPDAQNTVFADPTSMAISPRGEHISYSTVNAARPNSAPSTFIVNTRNTTSVALPPEAVGTPAFSPDGARVAFCMYNPVTGIQLYVANSNGTNQRFLTEQFSYNHSTPTVTWSPNGSKIALTVPPDTNNLFIVDVSSGNVLKIKAGTRYPAWSPDGSQIAFTNTSRDFGFGWKGMDIYIVNANGAGKPTQVSGIGSRSSSSPYADLYPAWSPDGKKLLYVHLKQYSYTGSGELVLLDLATGVEKILAEDVYRGFWVHTQ